MLQMLQVWHFFALQVLNMATSEMKGRKRFPYPLERIGWVHDLDPHPFYVDCQRNAEKTETKQEGLEEVNRCCKLATFCITVRWMITQWEQQTFKQEHLVFVFAQSPI